MLAMHHRERRRKPRKPNRCPEGGVIMSEQSVTDAFILLYTETVGRHAEGCTDVGNRSVRFATMDEASASATPASALGTRTKTATRENRDSDKNLAHLGTRTLTEGRESPDSDPSRRSFRCVSAKNR